MRILPELPILPLLLRSAAILWLSVPAVIAFSCSTVEDPTFGAGDTGCVAGGCLNSGPASSSSTTSSSTGMMTCMPDAGCAVSWQNDIYAGIIDGPPGCTTAGLCHGGMAGGLTLETNKAHEAYTNLMGFTLGMTPGPAKQYIVPCEPTASGFPCNMAVDADAGASNPFNSCGNLMPLTLIPGPQKLTIDQINKIANWITCGAPEN